MAVRTERFRDYEKLTWFKKERNYIHGSQIPQEQPNMKKAYQTGETCCTNLRVLEDVSMPAFLFCTVLQASILFWTDLICQLI